jgi:hypothetical protein
LAPSDQLGSSAVLGIEVHSAVADGLLAISEFPQMSLEDRDPHYCGRAVALFFYAFAVSDKFDIHAILA